MQDLNEETRDKHKHETEGNNDKKNSWEACVWVWIALLSPRWSRAIWPHYGYLNLGRGNQEMIRV
jgi:hypothetical protein